MGAIKQGVKTLDEGQREVDRKITGLQRTVAGLVTREDCRAQRAELTARIRRPTPSTSKQRAIDSRPGLLETAGRKATAIAAILALVSMVVGGLFVLARFVGQVERTVEATRKEQKRQTTQVLHELRQPRPTTVYYQPVPSQPDAGPRRRHRRRRSP